MQSIQQLAQVASKHPYYRFNYAWSRQVESAVWYIVQRITFFELMLDLSQCYSILLCGWLGGFGKGEPGQLLTLEDVGKIMNGE